MWRCRTVRPAVWGSIGIGAVETNLARCTAQMENASNMEQVQSCRSQPGSTRKTGPPAEGGRP
jgi:hypothetical protein